MSRRANKFGREGGEADWRDKGASGTSHADRTTKRLTIDKNYENHECVDPVGKEGRLESTCDGVAHYSQWEQEVGGSNTRERRIGSASSLRSNERRTAFP